MENEKTAEYYYNEIYGNTSWDVKEFLKSEMIDFANKYHQQKVKENELLHDISGSLSKCWNCNFFEANKENESGRRKGGCVKHKAEVWQPKWQKCEDFKICNNA